MKLETILQEIEKDSSIDIAALDKESLKISLVHAKYYRMFIEELKILKSLEIEYNISRKERMEYYLGKAPDEKYKEEPLDHRILKADLDYYLQSDTYLVAIERKKEIQKLKTETLETFIKQINQRSFNIRNAIEFQKFQNGLV